MKIRRLITAAAVVLAMFFSASASAAPNGVYAFDAAHTFVTFKIGRANASSAYGMFAGGDGSFTLDGNASKMKVNFTLKTDQIYTGNKKRDGHLTGPDFFNAKQFPKIEFSSSSVKKSGDTYTVSGNLKMHGKTKATTLILKKVGEGKNQQGKDYVGFEGELTINRKDFGITYLDGYLSDTVAINIAADGVK
ncbi:MAG: YceI family protein [Myxococcota bacterium]